MQTSPAHTSVPMRHEPASPPPSGIVRIGLTGGIGAGKSTVARIWREAGTAVLDLDAFSRSVLDVPGEGVEEAVASFGERFRNPAGTVHRQALGALVFSDTAARARLEEIVLSRVAAAVDRAEQDAQREGHRLVVHDSPLLLEKHQEDRYRCVVAVLTPRQVRIERVLRRNPERDRAYVEAVMAAQVEDLERIRRTDRLVLNTGDEQLLRARALHALEAASTGVSR